MCKNRELFEEKTSDPTEAVERESDYRYIPGVGFVENDPSLSRKRHLRFVAGHIGMAMIFYILLSALLTLPLVMLFSSLGLPVGFDLASMQVYGSQLMLTVVNITVTVLKLGVPALFLFVSLRQYTRFSPFRVSPRFGSTLLSLPIFLAVASVSAFLIGILQKGAMMVGIFLPLPNVSLPTEPLSFVLTFVLMTAVPALLEEFLFRGLVMQGLRCFGDGVALLLSSLLFGLAHFSILQDINAFLMGLLLGYFVLRTGSLWTGVILHFANNLLAIVEMILFRTVFSGCSEIISLSITLGLILLSVLALIIWMRKEPTLFSIPLPEKESGSTGKRLTLCLGSTGFLLALLLFVFFTAQTGV